MPVNNENFPFQRHPNVDDEFGNLENPIGENPDSKTENDPDKKTEAEKEKESSEEDFSPFDVDKVDDLEKEKEKDNKSDQ